MPVYAKEHALFCGNHDALLGLEQDISLELLSQHQMTVRPHLLRAELAPLFKPRVPASV